MAATMTRHTGGSRHYSEIVLKNIGENFVVPANYSVPIITSYLASTTLSVWYRFHQRRLFGDGGWWGIVSVSVSKSGLACAKPSGLQFTTTKMAFGPSHLSRLVLDPGLKGSLVPVPMARGRNRSLIPVGATNRDQRIPLWSRLVAPTGTKNPTL